MQLSLMNLLIFHKNDKKLSFLTCMLMVQLTEIPQMGDYGLTKIEYEKSWMHHKSHYRHRMYEILRSYKEAFLKPQVISVLMEHLAECLQMEQRNDKHDQMIELIIVLFKQLLQIPDPKPG
jgi:plasmid replication initiation protein